MKKRGTEIPTTNTYNIGKLKFKVVNQACKFVNLNTRLACSLYVIHQHLCPHFSLTNWISLSIKDVFFFYICETNVGVHGGTDVIVTSLL